MLALASIKSAMVRNVRFASTVVGCTVDALGAFPYKNAVKFGEESVSFNYANLLKKVRFVANGLYELGLKPGDSFVSWTDNRSEALVSFYACAMTGVRFVSVDPRVNTASALGDILHEVEPSTILYNPSSEVDRASVLKELVPEIASADYGMMLEPVRNRAFSKLRTVVSTEWDRPANRGVLCFRALLVEQCFPDLVCEVSRRLQEEPETTLLRSYSYNQGQLYKSKDLTQKQVSEYAGRVATKLGLTADSIVSLDLPLYKPLSLISAVACLQSNAMLVVPQAIPTLESTSEVAGKEKATQVVTTEKHAERLKAGGLETVKVALYPTECSVCKPMTGLKTRSF